MNLREIETGLAHFTLAALIIYFPAETWVSWPHEYGLLNPFYLVDLIAMILMLYGAVHSLHARPRSAPGVLCAAYAWAASNGWRATAGRAFEVLEGQDLDYGIEELWIVGIATAMAMACLALSMYLVVRGDATD